MSETIKLYYFNELYCHISCERYILLDLYDHFSFEVENKKFIPTVQNKIWDGMIHLIKLNAQLIYVGLIPALREYCKENHYSLEIDGYKNTKITEDEIVSFIKSLNLSLTPRLYQVKSFIHAIQTNRSLILSPTGSGKSLIIYFLIRWYKEICGKILIVVPSINLVQQMYSDFIEYGFDSVSNCHRIYQGAEHFSDKQIHISTWQSIYKEKKQLQKYDVVIIDECHGLKAKCIRSILENMPMCKYRFGFTGTLTDCQANIIFIESLLSKTFISSTTKELIDKNYLSKLKIINMLLNYNDEVKTECEGMDYNQEIDFIIDNEQREKVIVDLCKKYTGNKMVLFTRIAHGEKLYQLLKEYNEKTHLFTTVYFIYGGTDKEERERIRKQIEKESNSVLVASYGTFSVGVNIRNLLYIVFASPYKSKIKVLQSIGRGLRKHMDKEYVTIFDLVDILNHKSNNYLAKQYLTRMEYYRKEKFETRVTKVDLK